MVLEVITYELRRGLINFFRFKSAIVHMGFCSNKEPEAATQGIYAYHTGQVPEPTGAPTEESREGELTGQEEDYSHQYEEESDHSSHPVTREPIDNRHPLDPANLNRQNANSEDTAEADDKTEQKETSTHAEQHASPDNGKRNRISE